MSQLAATNIGTVEVGNAIGLGVHDYGMLCNDMVIEVDHVDGGITWYKSGATRAYRINKWSKWKPLKYGGVTPITDAIIEGEDCGLVINSTLFSTMGASLIDWFGEVIPQYTWVYNPPTGTANYPYRIEDFRSYQHESLPLFNMPATENGMIYVTQLYPALSLPKTYDLSISQIDGGITVDDLGLSSHYLGIMVLDYNIYDLTSSIEDSIILIKTATETCDTSVEITPNFISIPTNELLLVAFFLSPRTHDIVYPEGSGAIPQYSDYVWLDSGFYWLSLYNESAETILWQFDKTASNYDTISESNSNSDFYSADSTDFPTNNSTYGIWFSTSDFFTLYPYYDTVNHSNGYAMKIVMEITGEAGGDNTWRNLCTYSTAYDEYTGSPSSWNMIYCMNDDGYFCIGHGDPYDIDPARETETYNYEDVTKIEIRNYYYPSGVINTMYVHVHIFTTDPDTPDTIYSFSVSGERMWTPVYLRFGKYLTFEAPQYMKFNYLSIVSTPNTA